MKHIVIDLEMNPVNRDNRSVRRVLSDEVIEFGAVKLNEKFEQEDEFQCYVRPLYGKIKKHITQLTGITDEKVADGEDFTVVFPKFIEWVGDSKNKIYSWSMSDIKQLKNECRLKLKDFDTAKLDECWIDLQKEFDDRLGLTNSLGLKHALGAMDRNFEGTAHTALADAANTAAILTLMQDEKKFRQTMQPVLDLLRPKEDLSSSIGDLCPELLELGRELGN